GGGRPGRRLSLLWRPSEFFFDQLTRLFIIIVGNRSGPLDGRSGRTKMSREEGADDGGFAQFEQFLEAWSRRDFLKRAGGAAADLPKTSSDGLTYTFKLRSNLKFSDGQPITSDDVKFTYQLAYDPQYAAVSSPRRGDLSKYIASIDTPDPQTVVIKTTQVFAPFLANHALYGILPKHVLGSMTPAQI